MTIADPQYRNIPLFVTSNELQRLIEIKIEGVLRTAIELENIGGGTLTRVQLTYKLTHFGEERNLVSTVSIRTGRIRFATGAQFSSLAPGDIGAIVLNSDYLWSVVMYAQGELISGSSAIELMLNGHIFVDR